MAALAAVVSAVANPDLEGRWRLDTERSSPLSGWHAMDLVIAVDGDQIDITHHMRWRHTRVSKTNAVDVSAPVVSDGFFRVEARHMAVYPTKGGTSETTAEWIDEDRTLRTETHTSVEVSQGDVPLRITSEYRIGEGAETLTLIELRSSRPRPLVYFLRKVNEEDAE
jgi:hypothetical protein